MRTMTCARRYIFTMSLSVLLSNVVCAQTLQNLEITTKAADRSKIIGEARKMNTELSKMGINTLWIPHSCFTPDGPTLRFNPDAIDIGKCYLPEASTLTSLTNIILTQRDTNIRSHLLLDRDQALAVINAKAAADTEKARIASTNATTGILDTIKYNAAQIKIEAARLKAEQSNEAKYQKALLGADKSRDRELKKVAGMILKYEKSRTAFITLLNAQNRGYDQMLQNNLNLYNTNLAAQLQQHSVTNVIELQNKLLKTIILPQYPAIVMPE